jgi:SAM-dependent methyltransferase
MAIGSPEPDDPKRGEREYFARIGEEGRRHAALKPFSDEHCGTYLVNLATVLELMPPPPARVIEFGCGTGWLGQLIALRGYAVTGIDISPEAIELAKASAAARGVHVDYRVADYEEPNLPSENDVAIFHDALHHAESETAALRAAYAALRAGGMAICLEPGEGHSRSESSRRAVSDFGVHEKDMPPPTILRHARAAGFRRSLVLPMPLAMLRSTYRRTDIEDPTTNHLGLRLWTMYRAIRAHFRTRRQGMVILWKD